MKDCSSCIVCNQKAINCEFKILEVHENLTINETRHVHCCRITFNDKQCRNVIIKCSNHRNEHEVYKFIEKQSYKLTTKPVLQSYLNAINDFNVVIVDRAEMDLFDLTQQDSTESFNHKCACVQMIVDKIAALHDISVAHLDLSLENIVIKDDQFYLIDFDVSRVLDPQEDYHFYTNKENSYTFGKTGYRPIEHQNKLPSNGFQIDIFAIGIITFFIFFDKMPFQDYESRNYDYLHTGKMIRLLKSLCIAQRMYSEKELIKILEFIRMCCSPQNERPKEMIYLCHHSLFKQIKTNQD